MRLKPGQRPGQYLENYIDTICAYCNAKGYHAHKNQPKRLANGAYLEGEPFDYEFFIKGRVLCFDAKENFSGGTKWQIQMSGSRGKVTNERIFRQAEHLVHCKRNGATEAFFLVLFDKEKNNLPCMFVKYDAELVYNSMQNGVKFLDFDQGVEFDLKKFLQEV